MAGLALPKGTDEVWKQEALPHAGSYFAQALLLSKRELTSQVEPADSTTFQHSKRKREGGGLATASTLSWQTSLLSMDHSLSKEFFVVWSLDSFVLLAFRFWKKKKTHIADGQSPWNITWENNRLSAPPGEGLNVEEGEPYHCSSNRENVLSFPVNPSLPCHRHPHISNIKQCS